MNALATASHPVALPVEIANLPDPLRALPQWVGWDYVYRDDSWTKPPRNPRDGTAVSVNNPHQWGSLADAMAAYRRGRGDGIGFVLTGEDPFFALDLDTCFDGDLLNTWAAEIVERTGGSLYLERSPSGKGLRGIGRGTLPPGRRKNDRFEVYDRGRFVTLTGHIYENHTDIGADATALVAELHADVFGTAEPAERTRQVATTPPADDMAIIEQCQSFKNGTTFDALMRGSTADYDGDESRADAALLELLLFANGGEIDQAVRIASSSALWREKWESRRGETDYLHYSAERIRARMTRFHEPRGQAPGEPEPTTPTQPRTTGAVLVSLADIEPQDIDWLWRLWIPRRMLTILGGYGGDGKSTLAACLIAQLTSGGVLPDGTRAPVTNCLLLAAEDDASFALVPRLNLHGADLARVQLLKGTTRADGSVGWFNLQKDIDAMRDAIRDHDIGFVVIDPLSAYMPKADRNSEGDVRDALMPLQQLMDETGVAVLGIMHIGKGSDPHRRASQRLLGSTAFTALARSVVMLTELPDDYQPDTGAKRKVVGVVKSNYAIPPSPLEFSRPLDAPIDFHGLAPIGIEAAFAAGPKASKQDLAEAWLADYLKDGPKPSHEAEAAAKDEGFSNRTYWRARTALRVESVKEKNHWHLRLPAEGDHAGETNPESAADPGKSANFVYRDALADLNGEGAVQPCQPSEIGRLDPENGTNSIMSANSPIRAMVGMIGLVDRGRDGSETDESAGICVECDGPLEPGHRYRCQGCVDAEYARLGDAVTQ